MNKIKFCLIIVLIMLFPFSSVYAEKTIPQDRIVEDNEHLQEYLERHGVSMASDDSAVSGLIKAFATNGSNLCAISANDTICIFDKTNIIRKFSFYDLDKTHLFFDGDKLILLDGSYLAHDGKILTYQIASDEFQLYRVDDPHDQFTVYNINSMKNADTAVANGFYLRNTRGWSHLEYNELVWVEDGCETVLYHSNYPKSGTISAVNFFIAACVLLYVFVIKKRIHKNTNRNV